MTATTLDASIDVECARCGVTAAMPGIPVPGIPGLAVTDSAGCCACGSLGAPALTHIRSGMVVVDLAHVEQAPVAAAWIGRHLGWVDWTASAQVLLDSVDRDVIFDLWDALGVEWRDGGVPSDWRLTR